MGSFATVEKRDRTFAEKKKKKKDLNDKA